jgi:hypothetical protein
MAKKKSSSKRRRQAPTGVDPNEKRRERLEARRRAKAEAIAAQQKAERRARIVRTFFYVGLLALAIWFFFLRGGSAPEEIAGHEVQSFSTAGEGVHTPPFDYDTSPPVAGPHSDVIPCGTYGTAVANENLVHSLEHGAVYALYSPDLPVPQIRTLEGLAEQEGWSNNFLVAPYDGEMPEGTLISIGSWGYRMDLEEVDENAIVQYYDEFNGTRTNEAGVGCDNTSDQTFQAPDEGEEQGPAAGNEAEETPTPEES